MNSSIDTLCYHTAQVSSIWFVQLSSESICYELKAFDLIFKARTSLNKALEHIRAKMISMRSENWRAQGQSCRQPRIWTRLERHAAAVIIICCSYENVKMKHIALPALTSESLQTFF